MIFNELPGLLDEALIEKNDARKAELLRKFETNLDELLVSDLGDVKEIQRYFRCLSSVPMLIDRFALKIIRLNTEVLAQGDDGLVPRLYEVMQHDRMNSWLLGNLGNECVYNEFMKFALLASVKMQGLVIYWFQQNDTPIHGKRFPRYYDMHMSISKHLRRLYGDYQIGFDQDDTWERIMYTVYIDAPGEHIVEYEVESDCLT